MPYKVAIIESESAYGQRVDEIKEFDDEKEALEFVKDFNSYNNESIVPDWYMYATPPKWFEKKE